MFKRICLIKTASARQQQLLLGLLTLLRATTKPVVSRTASTRSRARTRRLELLRVHRAPRQASVRMTTMM